MSLILLRRVFVQDLDAFTTQWRQFLFNTLDPDGPILENLVINSTAFELADAALIWTNPLNGDQYFWNATPNTVSKTAGSGPVTPPVPPDLSDPYGLRYVHEYTDWQQRTCKFEIYKRAYEGASEEVEGAGSNLSFAYENEGKVFEPFRGSRAALTLKSSVSRKFHELFEGDERDHYGRYLVSGVVKWTGWITPDIFSEPWANPPYLTTLNFNDGIGGLKNLPFPDVNSNGYTGTISEKDAIIACLGRIGLRLDVHIACNIREESMDTLSAPIEQSEVNVEAFVKLSQGESQPLNSYEVLSKILKSWNAVILQEENKWWIVREPELYEATLTFKRFDADGVALGTSTRSLDRTFTAEGINLHGANLETKPAFTNVAVAQENGELLVENGNFAVNGTFENWTPYIAGGYQQGWRLNDWTYDKLEVFPFTNPTSLGRVRRVTENTGLDEVNNFINVFEVVRSFADPIGRLVSKPVPIRQEVGNLLQVTFKTRCNTKGSDKRLVEAYFNIAVRCGSQWLDVEGDTAEWVGVETRIRWKVAEVMRWENIVLPTVAIPEDGDIRVYLYQIVQVGSVSKTEYVCDFDDVEIKLVDNPALQNSRIYYKTNNPETYTSTLEELTIELGDVATVMSQNAKIIDGVPSARWTRPGDAVAVPLAQLICRELANQYQRTTYRLKGGGFYADASRLATYQDTVNEPDRKFLLTGGDYNAKTGEWNPDFVEINQQETTVEIRVVQEAKSGRDNSTGANSGGGPESTGDTTPAPPVVPVDLGDVDDVIPIIRDGKFEDSGISALRDTFGIISEYVVAKPFRGVAAVNDDQYVIKSQINTVLVDGVVTSGTAVQAGNNITYNTAWQWRISNVNYSPASSTVLTFPATSSGFVRVDLVVGNNLNQIVRVAGTAVAVGTPAAAPAIPSGSIALQEVSVIDTGIQAVTNFALASFVRFDIATQGLNATQRANARTNIGAIDLNSALTGYTVGANTALNTNDTLLGGFGKIQGQLNARVSGTISSPQIPFGTGVNTVGGDSGLVWDNTNKILLLTNNTLFSGVGQLNLRNLVNTNKRLRIGFDGTNDIGFIQATEIGVANRNISLNPNGGSVGIAITSPTNTLDVNGTTRIRTISNLGSTATRFLVASATGVVSERTGAEARVDIGAEASITAGTALQYWRGDKTFQTLNTAAVVESTNLYFTEARVRASVLTGYTVGTNTALSATDSVLTAFQNVQGQLNNRVPITRTLTINGTALDLSADRSWTIGADGNKVSYNVADSKTASERMQARVNIGSTSATPEVIATAGAINNLAVTSNHLVFTGSTVVLSGIAAGLDGEEITILNASGTNLELLSQSALSTDNNRFASGLIVPNLSVLRIKYRTTTARWVLENVGINDGRYVRKDVADTKTGNLTLTNAAIINGHLDVNGSTSASPGVALNRIRNAVAGSGITQFFGTNGGSARQHFAFYGSGDVEYLSLGNGWVSSGTPTLRAVNTILLEQNAVSNIRSNASNRLTRRDELYLNYAQTVATAGTINDLAINADCKLLILTGATDLTGVIPVDNTRLLRIEASGANRIIRHESASSTAANRFSIGADLTINAGEVYQFIYTSSRWRRIL